MSTSEQQLPALFERLGEQIGRRLAPSFARPQPTPAPAPTPKRQRPAARKPSRKPKQSVPALRPAERIGAGATVWYRQGRGAFEAEVIRVNASEGTVVLQRTMDLKRIVRPREKVFRAR